MTEPTPQNLQAVTTAFNEALRDMGFIQGVAIQVDLSNFAHPWIVDTAIFNVPAEPA